MAVQQVHDDVTDLVDRDKLIRWALELSSFYSPTGEERAVAEYLYEEYRKLGLRAKLQPISEERYNAIGLLEGSGNGLSLMFNGHLDVSHTGREESLPGGRHTFGSPVLPVKLRRRQLMIFGVSVTKVMVPGPST